MPTRIEAGVACNALEPSPLDTAGAIRFAALAVGATSERIVVCNGDVLTDLDLGIRDFSWPEEIMQAGPEFFGKSRMRYAVGLQAGGELVGVMTLNDANIFCMPEQIKEEFAGVMRLVERAYRDLGITQYTYRLSLRDKADKTKYVENDAMWDLAENMLREAMNALGLPYTEAPGEAAFYGPKLDIQLADVMGHQETYSTIQLDFHLPNQFDLGYVGADGQLHRPVMIHRGVISTMERMVSYLIELYAGAFPAWLAPVQTVVLPITERQNAYAEEVNRKLLEAGIRSEFDGRNEKLQAKIRDAQLQKIPYMLVIGGKEAEAGTVSVRHRSKGDLGPRPLEQFSADLKQEIDMRAIV